MREIFDKYLLELRRTPLDEHTEYTGRAALETLLNAFAARAGKDIRVQHEPKRVPGKGAPDFKVLKSGAILGYVENKGIGEDLDQTLKSDQIAKYKSLSGNILLTNYLHWIWIRNGSVQREILCFPTDPEKPKFRVQDVMAAAVAALIEGFFSTAPEGIGRAQQLALALATRSQLLRDFLGEELVRQEREHKEGRLYGLFEIFRDQVSHELTLQEFADAFAQMLAYGLFLARLNSDSKAVTLHNAREYVPGSFRLIRELVDFLIVLDNPNYRDIRWVVEEVLSIVNGLDLAAIHEDLSFQHRKAISRKVRAKDEEEWRLFSLDPYVYFYEDYLAKYDPQMRKSRGIYYTPPPVVNFIIRAVDNILKDTFAIKDGLADHKRVTVLDFACGTGTFLVEVFERIFENIGGPDSGKAGLVVHEHILKNIYGFEYLIAPYTIAHLKLSQFLADRGHALTEDESLQVLLTNTLEPVEPQRNLLLPALTQETQSAQKVKDNPILVITGNPPYSGFSKNMGEAAKALIERYKYVDGQHFGERKHWLHDDYVKFIAFAQKKMDAVEEGVVAIITNHSWVDNPTFRGMRQSLMETFQQIYIVDLHGSSKPLEVAPDGQANENVFDIMKGVAVSLFIKNPNAKRGIWYGDVWGSRLEKYVTCASTNFNELADNLVVPSKPFYFFSPRTSPDISGWFEHKSLEDIFMVQSVGVLTARDRLNVAFSPGELLQRLGKFSQMDVETARERFNLRPDTRDWKIQLAQDDLRQSNLDAKFVKRFAYRPFDERFVFYTGRSKGLIGQPANPLSENMEGSRLALGTTRRVESGDYRHAFAFSLLPDGHSVSSKESTHVFPLYLKNTFGQVEDNFRPNFKKFLIDNYGGEFNPTETFGYIYAVLYSPSYRNKFDEWLADDYARIPFPPSQSHFKALSALGWDLIQKHLLHDVPALGLGRYRGKGDNDVVKPRYVESAQAVYINSAQHFAPVPQEVWDFYIGGYQVLAKYLKDRKGRTLTLDEIGNVENVANVLAYTITAMRKIAGAYDRAFSD